MVSTDPIADMLTRIRNAASVRREVVEVPHSNIKAATAQLLAEHGYVEDIRIEGEAPRRKIIITLAPDGQASPISNIERLSRPGRRLYVSADEIPRIKSGRGVVILSTSQGLMSGGEAKKKRIGGELICKVY